MIKRCPFAESTRDRCGGKFELLGRLHGPRYEAQAPWQCQWACSFVVGWAWRTLGCHHLGPCQRDGTRSRSFHPARGLQRACRAACHRRAMGRRSIHSAPSCDPIPGDGSKAPCRTGNAPPRSRTPRLMLMMMMTVIHDIWFAGILWIFVLRPLLILSITIGEMPFIDARDCLFASVYYV